VHAGQQVVLDRPLVFVGQRVPEDLGPWPDVIPDSAPHLAQRRVDFLLVVERFDAVDPPVVVLVGNLGRDREVVHGETYQLLHRGDVAYLLEPPAAFQPPKARVVVAPDDTEVI
jgi:hypothetical protein